eukprot:2493413-Pyramimonas_sp.AAC.1
MDGLGEPKWAPVRHPGSAPPPSRRRPLSLPSRFPAWRTLMPPCVGPSLTHQTTNWGPTNWNCCELYTTRDTLETGGPRDDGTLVTPPYCTRFHVFLKVRAIPHGRTQFVVIRGDLLQKHALRSSQRWANLQCEDYPPVRPRRMSPRRT